MNFDDVKDLWEANDGRFVVVEDEDGRRYPVDLNIEEREIFLIEKDDEREEVVRRMLAAGASLVHDADLGARIDAWSLRALKR